MSTTQTAIRKSFSAPVLNLVKVSGGFYLVASVTKTIGVRQTQTSARTSAAKETVQSSPVVTHKWAERVGMYNDDPIWAAIVKNVKQSRKRERRKTKSLE